MSFTKVTELFITHRGRYYFIEGLFLDEQEFVSKRFEYKALKFSTFKNKLDSLLKEYELV